MPHCTLLDMAREAQAQMLAAVRRARYGYLLALHVLLVCAAGRTPSEIAACLFCSRSRVYRTVRAYRTGTRACTFDEEGQWRPPIRTTVRLPTLRRALLAWLKTGPQTYGWCRTRWSCATLALTLPATRGLTVSAETLRRWLHEVGWVWQRAKLAAKDDDPHRIARVARIRFVCEPLHAGEAMIFADELDISLLPKVGAAWMPKGTQRAVMTPGTHAKHDLAGALDGATGVLLHGCGPRKTNALFRDLLQVIEEHDPTEPYTRLDVVVDHDKIHQAKAVQPWLVDHPRVTLLLLPTYCPRAHPIERAFGDVHDCCTRNHRRKRVPDLIADVEAPLHVHGPWLYKLSQLSYAPAITAAVEKIAAEEHAKVAA
jgi:putative transposase